MGYNGTGNVDYLGGALSNGSGCRINADTQKNGYIEFTLGTGKFEMLQVVGEY